MTSSLSFLFRDYRPLLVTYGIFLAGYFIVVNRDHLYTIYGLLVLLLVCHAWENRQQFLHNRPMQAALVFLAYMTLSSLWSEDLTLFGFYHQLGETAATLNFLIVTAYLFWKDPHRFYHMLRVVTVIVAALGLLAIVLFYADHPFPKARLVSFGELNNPGYMGSTNGVFVVLAAFFLLSARTGLQRGVFGVSFVLLMAVVILAQSRSAFMATLAGVTVLVIWQGKHRLLTLISASLIVGLFLAIGGPLVERFLTTGQDVSSDLRQEIWDVTLAQIAAHPLFGHGYLTPMQLPTSVFTFDHPHSVYLATVWYGGVAGLLLLLLLLAVSLREAYRKAIGGGPLVYIALLVYTMICVVVDYGDIITGSREAWLQFWFAIALTIGIGMRRWSRRQALSGNSEN